MGGISRYLSPNDSTTAYLPWPIEPGSKKQQRFKRKKPGHSSDKNPGGEREKLFKKLVDDLYEKGKAINAASLLEFDTVLDPIESRDWISMVVESPINSSEKVPKNRYIDSW